MSPFISLLPLASSVYYLTPLTELLEAFNTLETLAPLSVPCHAEIEHQEKRAETAALALLGGG